MNYNSYVKSIIKQFLTVSLKKSSISPLLLGPAKGILTHQEICRASDKYNVFFREILPSEKVSRRKPWEELQYFAAAFQDSLNYFHSSRGIYEIDNGSIIGVPGWILNKTGLYMEDLSSHFSGEISPVLNSFRLCTDVKFLDRICSFQSPAADNYFHWMTDVLPRIRLYIESDNSCNLFYVAEKLPFQVESLQKFGISRENCIRPESKVAVKAEKIIAPSMLHESGHVSLYASNTAKTLFLNNTKFQRKRRLYIERGSASNTRRLKNEPDLTNFLKKQGFQTVTMDHLTVSEQAALFNSADVIVAAHGAALTNLLFCEPGTSVIELFGHSYVNPCYWEISSNIGLNYWPVVEIKDQPPIAFGEPGDFTIQPEWVADALDRLEKLI